MEDFRSLKHLPPLFCAINVASSMRALSGAGEAFMQQRPSSENGRTALHDRSATSTSAFGIKRPG